MASAQVNGELPIESAKWPIESESCDWQLKRSDKWNLDKWKVKLSSVNWNDILIHHWSCNWHLKIVRIIIMWPQLCEPLDWAVHWLQALPEWSYEKWHVTSECWVGYTWYPDIQLTIDNCEIWLLKFEIQLTSLRAPTVGPAKPKARRQSEVAWEQVG